MSLQLIEALEQGGNGFIVRFLGTGKSRFVDTIVDRFVVCVDHVVNLLHQFWWAKSRSVAESFLGELIEHSDDFTTLIVDNRCMLLVPQDRNSADAATFIPAFKSPVVDAFQTRFSVHCIRSCTFLIRIERPRTVCIHTPVDDINADVIFQTEKCSHDERSMGPWTGMRDVEMVTPAFNIKRPSFGNGVTEFTRLSHEFT